MSGRTSYHAGLAAEDIVAKEYARRDVQLAHSRWRGKAGEIDLVLREGARVVFVEVKKSNSFEAAAQRVSRRQMDRIYAAASEFIGREPDGQLTEVRFDVAVVDQRGAVQILENAFADV